MITFITLILAAAGMTLCMMLPIFLEEETSIKPPNDPEFIPIEPEYVHVGVGPHWVKCTRLHGNNYVVLTEENTCDPEDGKCVVCGKVASVRDCLPRDV